MEPIKDAGREEAAVDLDATWRQASKLFSGMRFGFSPPNEWWALCRRLYGDTITSSRTLDHWRKLAALVKPLDDAQVDYLRVLAQQRFEFSAAAFRVNAVASVTLPVSGALLVNQLAPGRVQEFIADDTLFWTVLALGLLLNLSYIFGNVFKARELRMALELLAADRRLARGETLASAGGDTSDVSP